MKSDAFITLAHDYLSAKTLDGFEVFCLEKDHFLADARDRKIESLENASESGLAVRVINEGRMGFSYTTSGDAELIKKCVDSAIEGSKEIDMDEAWSFSAGQKIDEFDWKYNDEKLDSVPVPEKLNRAINLEASAFKADFRIKKVRRASYEESKTRMRLVNSEGVDIAHEGTLVSCQITAVAESGGDSQWAWDFDFSHTYDGLAVDAVGVSAAREAVSLLGAKSIATMKVKAYLHPFVAGQFLKVFARGFYGDNIYKKKSALVNKLGQKLFSEKLSIVNDGLLKGGYGSARFDGEGEPCKKTSLVKDGIVENWLTDIYWGQKLGLPSTGCSSRNTVNDLPAIGISNLYIEPSKISSEEILGEMGTGFYITDVIGVHTANPITGDYSVGAAGQWVENGKIMYPVKGVLVAGNLHDLFNKVVFVADDLRFIGGVGSPSLLVSEMQVSGQ